MSELPQSKDRYNIVDFPGGAYSQEDLRDAMTDNLDEVLEHIPELPIEEITIQNLENIDPGTYHLKSRPDVSLLRELPQFSDGLREVGLFCIQGVWMIVLGHDLEVRLPQTLIDIQDQRLFQLDIHTHPGTDPGAEQPSDADIYKLTSTIDGYNYIANEKGVLEYRLPEKLPGGFTAPTDVHRAWNHWIVNDLKLSENEYESIGGWELKKQFFEKFFGLKQISWSNTSEINAILNKSATL